MNIILRHYFRGAALNFTGLVSGLSKNKKFLLLGKYGALTFAGLLALLLMFAGVQEAVSAYQVSNLKIAELQYQIKLLEADAAANAALSDINKTLEHSLPEGAGWSTWLKPVLVPLAIMGIKYLVGIGFQMLPPSAFELAWVGPCLKIFLEVPENLAESPLTSAKLKDMKDGFTELESNVEELIDGFTGLGSLETDPKVVADVESLKGRLAALEPLFGRDGAVTDPKVVADVESLKGRLAALEPLLGRGGAVTDPKITASIDSLQRSIAALSPLFGLDGSVKAPADIASLKKRMAALEPFLKAEGGSVLSSQEKLERLGLNVQSMFRSGEERYRQTGARFARLEEASSLLMQKLTILETARTLARNRGRK